VVRRREWTDPAPLEVERPRLPWWVLLPKKLLWALIPVIVAVVLVKVVIFVGRRVYRYPVLIIASVVLAGVWLWARDWIPAAWLAGWLVLAGGGWWLLHRSSFERLVWAQLRSEYRRLRVYAFRWKRTMLFSDLDKTVRHTIYFPRFAGCGRTAGATG
jgi:S-DNA-T family DNA segregation ATPase FtsK/SpoIIIE